MNGGYLVRMWGGFLMARRYGILDASERIMFHTIYDAINDVIGTDYTGWMKATWPNTDGNGKFRL